MSQPVSSQSSEPRFRAARGTTPLLIGGAPVPPKPFKQARARTQAVIAADAGAQTALRHGLIPDAVFGDFDSLPQTAMDRIPADRLYRIAEQDSTDFHKALRNIDAEMTLAIGFTGRRIDHELAVWHSLLDLHARPCVVLGAQDAVTVAPRRLALSLPPGTRLSLFPFESMRAKSTGLAWEIDAVRFDPLGRVGTSNRVASGPVSLEFDRPSMLLIVPLDALDALLAGLAGSDRFE